MSRRRKSRGKAIARAAVLDLICGAIDQKSRVHVEGVSSLGEGAVRTAYLVEVAYGQNQETEEYYVALVPSWNADSGYNARAEAEVSLLGKVYAACPPFRVPEVLGTVSIDGQLVILQSFVQGRPFERRAARTAAEPWEVVGKVAAGIHNLKVESDVPPPTRRAFALESLAAFEGMEEPAMVRAHAWCLANLPRTSPERFCTETCTEGISWSRTRKRNLRSLIGSGPRGGTPPTTSPFSRTG